MPNHTDVEVSVGKPEVRLNTLSPCPRCQTQGSPVSTTTLRHTLKKPFRERVDSREGYLFCENRHCAVAYYRHNSTDIFVTDSLINRVTIKDKSPLTPLCYCFKISKGEVLQELEQSGTSRVVQRIEEKMAQQAGCFCEKANPRGKCCIGDIVDWLKRQDLTMEASDHD